MFWVIIQTSFLQSVRKHASFVKKTYSIIYCSNSIHVINRSQFVCAKSCSNRLHCVHFSRRVNNCVLRMCFEGSHFLRSFRIFRSCLSHFHWQTLKSNVFFGFEADWAKCGTLNSGRQNSNKPFSTCQTICTGFESAANKAGYTRWCIRVIHKRMPSFEYSDTHIK